MSCIVTDYLESIVKRYPNKTAFVDINRELTFCGLRKEAVCIAEQLIKRKYFKKPVLIYMDKSVACISVFLGVAYSGNFYSPIDTKMPTSRVEKIISILNPAVIITDEKYKEHTSKFALGVKVLVYEELITEYEPQIELIRQITRKIIDTDILYVMFTSGSTGMPKGVTINHRAVIDFIEWISKCYKFSEETVFANQAQLYFDLSIQDVYAPLRNGATTVMIPNRFFSTPIRVWNMILRYKINTLVWIPSMLSMFANLDILHHAEQASLKLVLFCGEVMPVKQLNYWIEHYPEVVYGNLYGPTECTEACTYYTIDRKFDDSEILPIGIPCENTDIIVIDEEGKEISTPGRIGELCVRGTSLSMGYYGEINKTAEVFVQNPLHDAYPEYVYKTGDLVRYNERYELVYISRKDFQIKKRGFRVELGEIEAAVSSIPNVTYNCCLFDSNREKLILIYTGDIQIEELKKYIREQLQEYMIPDECYKREEMLFNINGKIDRKALQKQYCFGE